MADPKAVQFLEGIYSRVDKQVRDIVTSMLPGVNFAAQDDGTVVANDHRIMNFQGPGVVVSDEPSMRRVNIFVPGAPVGSDTAVVVSNTTAKALSLWSGSANSPPPSGWQNPGYSDTTWTAAVDTGASGVFGPPSGSTAIWSTATPASNTQHVLFRQTFTITAGALTAATITLRADEVMDVYINGTFVTSHGMPQAAGIVAQATYSVPVSLLTPGASNLIAVRGYNYNPTGAYVGYRLNLSTASGGTDTQYIPKSIITTKGDVIVGASSANPVRLGVGTNGYVLTANSAATNGLDWEAAGGMSNPMTMQDDIIVGGSSGTPGRLAKGLDGQVLTIDSSSHHVAWTTPSGGGGSGSGALTQISAQTVGVGGASSITFSSIAGAYNSLECFVTGRGDLGTAAAVGFGLRCNGDTGNNYDWQLASTPVQGVYYSASASYRNTVIADSPTLYWRLNELSGTSVADQTTNGNNGTISGGVTLNQTSLIVGSDPAFVFNGSTGLLYTTNSWSNPQTFTIECWFKSTSGSVGGLICASNTQAAGGANFDRTVWLDATGHVNAAIFNGATRTITSPATYNDNAAHHVVYSQSASGQALYVDGSQVASSLQINPQNYTAYWQVGYSNQSPTKYFNGTIDEFAVWVGTALSGTQILAHKNAGAGSGAGAGGTGASAASAMQVGILPAATAPSNLAGSVRISLDGYAGTTFQKVVRAVGSTSQATGAPLVQDHGGVWRSTSAITSLTLLPASGNFVQGTTAVLYGRT
jgi:hypothetical protein